MPNFVYYFKEEGDIVKIPLGKVTTLSQEKAKYAYSTFSGSFYKFRGTLSGPASNKEVPAEFKAYLLIEGHSI